MIVATAGHVDHGKTSLVKQLSGVDTDRLAEEKRRGLTIDLGFAYQRVTDDATIGFIDVPGHNRFINTMISGVSGIDMAMLVVAADDGPMPQTLEHLDILSLLGVTNIIGVLTRIDQVDTDTLEQRLASVESLLGADALLFKVNNLDGTGIPQLQQYLQQVAVDADTRNICGHFRMSIDRAFALKGTGLVITGTGQSGEVKVGDTLQLLPAQESVRVRDIHVQNEKSITGGARQRCALNITGSNKLDIKRGDSVCAPEVAMASRCIAVRLQLLKRAAFPVKHLMPVKLHLGARRIAARVYLLEKSSVGNQMAPGASALVQLNLQEDVACALGDRFVLRDDSESVTLGGGAVLDPCSKQVARRRQPSLDFLRALEQDNLEQTLAELLLKQHRVLDLHQFCVICNLRDDELEKLLHSDACRDRCHRFSSQSEHYATSLQRWRESQQLIRQWLEQWHREHPQEEGVAVKLLSQGVVAQLESVLFQAVVTEMVKQQQLKLVGGKASLASFRAQVPDAQQQLWQRLEASLQQYGHSVPVISQLQKDLSVDSKALAQVLRHAHKQGWAHPVGEKRYVLSSTLREMADALLVLAEKQGDFSVIDCKNHLGIGRNFAIELMEYFDSLRFTARRGDVRSVIDPELPATVFGSIQ